MMVVLLVVLVVVTELVPSMVGRGRWWKGASGLCGWRWNWGEKSRGKVAEMDFRIDMEVAGWDVAFVSGWEPKAGWGGGIRIRCIRGKRGLDSIWIQRLAFAHLLALGTAQGEIQTLKIFQIQRRLDVSQIPKRFNVSQTFGKFHTKRLNKIEMKFLLVKGLKHLPSKNTKFLKSFL